MSAMPAPSEPTLADVLHELRTFRQEVQLEFLTVRNDVQTVRAEVLKLDSRLQQFWDAFADFRREYDSHTHED